MGKTLTMVNITPEFLQDQPRAAGEIIARFMADAPDTIGLIIIGTREEAAEMERGPLFMYGPVTSAPLDEPEVEEMMEGILDGVQAADDAFHDKLTSTPSAPPEDQP